MSMGSEKYIGLMQRYWWLALLVVAGVTLAMLAQLANMKTNATPYFLGSEHPSRQADFYVKDHFTTSGESLFISVVSETDTIFNKNSLLEVQSLHESLLQISLSNDQDIKFLSSLNLDKKSGELIDQITSQGLTPGDYDKVIELQRYLQGIGGVTPSIQQQIDEFIIRLRPVKKVRSIVSVESITSDGDMLDIHPLMFSVPSSPEGIAELKEEALSNQVLMGALFEESGKATNMQVELLIPEDDAPNMQSFYLATVDAIQASEKFNSYHLGGAPVTAGQTAVSMKENSDRLFPAVILVVMVVLLIMFRNPRGILLPLGIAILSVIWTLGTMTLFGIKQNIVSTMLPVFLISIGVADAIHFLTEFSQHVKKEAKEKAVAKTIKALWSPMLVTTLTTAVGFLSLVNTDIAFIREFGLFVAVGVCYALIITMLLLPPILLKVARVKGVKATVAEVGNDNNSPQDNFIERKLESLVLSINRGLESRGKLTGIVLVIMAVLMGVSLSNLNVDNKAIKYFDADSQIRIDDEVINKYFAGSMLFSITLKADAPDAFKSMDTLEAIEKIQNRLAQHDDVGFSYSPVNFIKLLNQRLLSGDESDFKLPKGNDDLLAQYFFLYESSDGRGIFDTVDQKYQNARIIVFNHSDQSSVMERTLNDVLPYAKSVLPASMEIEASGFGELLVSTKNEVIYGQISSLSWSLVGVLILLSLVFRSVVFGILGTLPLTLTVFINFSIMPLLGMDLDIGTSLVAAIAIGVGVDYAIHFISRYRQQRMDGLEVNPAIHNALLAVYRPVIFNTLVLSLGFSMLGLSTFAALANLGYLIAMTMVISAISTLFILPVLIRFFPGSSELSATTTNLTPEEAV